MQTQLGFHRIAVLAFVTLLAACGGDSGPRASSSDPASLRVADAAIANGSPQVALQMVENLLQSNPRNAQALLRQGQAHMMSGNNAAAATSFRRALVIEPTLDTARLNLGRMALGSDPAQAEILFTAILAHDDSNIQALNNLGVAQDLQGRHADAQATYRRVLAIAPEQGSARQNLGLSLAVSGAPDQAVAMLSSISGHQTADRRGRDNLAVALALAGRSTEASQMLREELSPADAARMMSGLKGFTP